MRPARDPSRGKFWFWPGPALGSATLVGAPNCRRDRSLHMAQVRVIVLQYCPAAHAGPHVADASAPASRTGPASADASPPDIDPAAPPFATPPFPAAPAAPPMPPAPPVPAPPMPTAAPASPVELPAAPDAPPAPPAAALV